MLPYHNKSTSRLARIMHSLRLRPARDEDVPAMAALEVAAFLDSPMHKAMFPKRLRIKPGVQDQLEWNVARMRKGLADPSLHYLVVLTDAPGRGEIIVGCAEWAAPARGDHGEDEEEGRRRSEERERDLELRMARLPPFLDKSALLDANDEVMELIEKSKGAFRGQDRHRMWTLNSISVDGDYRGIGVGKMLTRWGMERAERDGTGIWIISSPLGLQLYRSLGFEMVAEGSRLGEPQYLMLKFYEPGTTTGAERKGDGKEIGKVDEAGTGASAVAA
ncbi:acyl-CoA N-acyltransferase [Trichoderma longibrachiatum]